MGVNSQIGHAATASRDTRIRWSNQLDKNFVETAQQRPPT